MQPDSPQKMLPDGASLARTDADRGAPNSAGARRNGLPAPVLPGTQGDAPAAWRFEIADGPNRGADIALPQGQYRFGADDGNDIVLADRAMAPQHLALAVTAAGASLTALATGVTLQNRALATGRRMALAHGAEIRIGGTLVRVHGPAGQTRPRPGPAPLALGAIAAFVLASGAAAFVASAPNSRSPRLAEAAAARPSAAVAARVLTDHLAAVKLDGSVKVAAEGSAVLATGALLPQDIPAWHGAQSWFDARYGRDVALVDKTSEAPAGDAPALSLAAIALSPVPHILTRDGERYTEGAVLKGGWSIVSITRQGVRLRRGTREVDIAS